MKASVRRNGAALAAESEARLALERQHTADALREREALYLQPIHALPAHIAILDRQGGITTVNRAWEDFASANGAAGRAAVAVGANYLDVCRRATSANTADAGQALAGIEAVLDGRQPSFTMEYHCPSPGEERWFLMTVVPLEPGGQSGAIITHLNITDRKQSEKALRLSERRYRQLFENNPNPMWVYDDKTLAFLAVNEAAIRLYGWSKTEFMALSALEVLPPEARAEAGARLRDPNGPRDSGNGLFQHWRKDGTRMDMAVTVTSLPFSGRPGRLALLADVTEQQRADKNLRQASADLQAANAFLNDSHRAALNLMNDAVDAQRQTEALRLTLQQREAQLRLFIKHAPAAIAMLDLDMRYVAVSLQWLEVYGLAGQDILGKSHYDVFPENLERWKEIHRRCLAGAVERADKDPFERADGTRQWLRWEVRPWNASADTIGGLVVFSEDITELQRTASELARSNQDLEQFAYVTSHDLKEPLRMVTSFLSLLKERYQGALDAKAGDYIDFASEAAARMQRLVDDLLAYSRIGREKATTPVDSGAPLDEAMLNLRAAITESGALVQRDPMPRVVATPLEMTQLFQNLIGNAIKFRKPSVRPEVHIGAVQDSGFWRFSVRDNGIGIDPAYHSRLFDIFQRLHAREEYEGTGVGLSICKKIVEGYGGSIWIDSREGQGSTFFFTLPA